MRFVFKVDARDPRPEESRTKAGRVKVLDGHIDADDLASAVRKLADTLSEQSPDARASLVRAFINEGEKPPRH